MAFGLSHYAISMFENKSPRQVAFSHEDRQWDCRFNVQQPEFLESILTGIRADYDAGRVKYVLVGGIEIGTRPYQDDYQVKHVHVAAIFHNRVSKRSILKAWNVTEGNGYYLVPRNRDLPYSGWRNHHIKEFSKVNQEERVLYEMGTLPADLKRKRVEEGEEEKKKGVNEILIDLRKLIEDGQETAAWEKYPKTFLQYGERIKAMVNQKRNFAKSKGDPHIWLHGYPGTGKSAVLNFVYPKYYKKNLHNKFFDLYNPAEHTHVMLEDLDHAAVDKLSINFIKTICDEAGFAVDQKYKTPQLARTTCLVTSNFSINDIVADGKGVEANRNALYRRFWHVHIMDMLRTLGLKMLPKETRRKLKDEGNTDPSKLFISWDYAVGMPTCQPLQAPEYYQEVIRKAYV